MQCKEFPIRKNNRLTYYDYNSCGAYFITICTKNKKRLFWASDHPNYVGEAMSLPPDDAYLSPYGKIVNTAIKAIPQYYSYIELLQYVIMPNHIHLLLLVTDKGGRLIASPTKQNTISTVVGQMKRQVSKEIGAAVWQRSFHDHVIRNQSDYEQISKYIYENPLKWQLDCFYSEE